VADVPFTDSSERGAKFVPPLARLFAELRRRLVRALAQSIDRREEEMGFLCFDSITHRLPLKVVVFWAFFDALPLKNSQRIRGQVN
jgi:hypothetical protein